MPKIFENYAIDRPCEDLQPPKDEIGSDLPQFILEMSNFSQNVVKLDVERLQLGFDHHFIWNLRWDKCSISIHIGFMTISYNEILVE